MVIGSGMSGLSSAILLSMRGWRVTVVEQHFRPGGLLSGFWRHGRYYDTGFHYCGSVDHSDILGRCLRHLGVHDRVDWLPMCEDGFDRVIFPGREFMVPVGVERYRDRLCEAFPHEASGIRGFIQDLEAATRAYGLYHFSADTDLSEIFRWEGTSLAEVVGRHISDPELAGILCAQVSLYGVPPKQAPFGIHAVVIHHFLRGAWRLRGGGEALASALVGRIEELGGEVRLRSRVAGVEVEGRRVAGVKLDSGEVLPVDLVISSMHPQRLLDLLPPGSVRPVFSKRVYGQQVGPSYLGAYLELDGPVDSLGSANIYRHTSFDLDRIFKLDDPRQEVPFYFAIAPGQVPGAEEGPSANTLLVSASLAWEVVEPWVGGRPGRRGPGYAELKEQLLERVMELVYSDHPDLRGHVVRSNVSTGLTVEHYTGSPRGAIYGHYHSVDQMGRFRPSQVLRVRNLVQVGQGVFAPGVLGATLSAYYGLAWHVGLDTLLSELETA